MVDEVPEGSRSLQWLPWAVLLIGAAFRLFRLGDWSLWEDEETSIYFTLNPWRPFPRAFPLYFFLLGRLYAVTGVSVYAGRLLSALIGIATLWLAYRCIRRFCGDRVALPALVLLVLSPGHLFWSQSIRYYMLVLAFQIASIHAFLATLERPSVRLGVLTTVWLVLAVSTHTTAVLLVPVYAAALAWHMAGANRSWLWSRGGLVAAVGGFALGVVAILSFAYLQPMFGHTQGRGVHLLGRFIAYTGLPAVALMLLAPVLARRATAPFVFFLLLATIPVGAVLVMRFTGLWDVAWYHAFISVIGVAAMAGYGWESLSERAPQWLLAGTGVGVVGASLALVVAYFTTAYGDRPRWREATACLSPTIGATTTGVDVFSPVPGVIAFYLGVPPGQTMGHPLVQRANWAAASGPLARETWFVLESRLVPARSRRWLQDTCELRGTFPAWMVIRDRSVLVYRCLPR